ncbi:MerR family transcriptional regulator [Oceanobacillus timonensis]|uniref:MerR family transcriptional regulator n=1 Tax=Oceanobacillus timonensis TaxID=1926285 RepID=UPI001FE29602|nr:MerR family transcriptional regulator [Oceanobacillus timonensis]
MDASNKLMTTGEFAALCDVKKQTLFHYDDIGLLEPEYKNENGYRFYSIQQAEAYSLIDMLKEIGMSLAEIKDFLQSKNPKKITDLLTEKEKLIDKKIEKLQRTQQLISNQKKQTERALQLDLDQFTITDMEMEQIVLSENILNYSHKDITKMIIAFMKYVKQGEINVENWGALIRQEQIETGDYLNYSHFFLRENSLHLTETYHTKAGKYIIGYHKGSYLSTYKTYDKIKAYLDKKGYRICGDSFEEYLYLMDGISLDVKANYVIKIMIQVEEK